MLSGMGFCRRVPVPVETLVGVQGDRVCGEPPKIFGFAATPATFFGVLGVHPVLPVSILDFTLDKSTERFKLADGSYPRILI
jgi:hypothetical protein